MDIIRTIDGYIIQDNQGKFALNQSKLTGKAPYYLMQIKPNQKYISGMFKSKDNPGLFQGKDINGQRVRVYINEHAGTGNIYWG